MLPEEIRRWLTTKSGHINEPHPTRETRGLKALFHLELGGRLVRPKDLELVRLGSEYGGWHVVRGDLVKGSVAVCVGAGEDITFDTALARQFGMRIVEVDPTPRAIAHVKATLADKANADIADQFVLEKSALGSEDGIVDLFFPTNPEHVSLSVIQTAGRTEKISVRMITLDSLFEKYRIAECCVLKMDIEGAEAMVVPLISSSRHKISQLCIEFDMVPLGGTMAGLRQALKCINHLTRNGYAVRAFEGWNVLFRRE